MQRNRFRRRRLQHALAQARIVGLRHRHEILVALLADQRVHAGEIDVVGDQHDRTRPHVWLERARRVGEDQRLNPCRMEDCDRRPHHRRVAAFIGVRAALQHRHLGSAQLSHHELSRMARHLRHRETRNVAIGNDQRIGDGIGHGSEARAEDDGGSWLAFTQQFQQHAHVRCSGPKE